MSLLGKVIKQPQEIEAYSINYGDDLADSEQITAAYNRLVNGTNVLSRPSLAIAHNVVAADQYAGFLVTAATTLTITAGLAALTEFYVANTMLVGTVVVAASELIDGVSTLNIPINTSVVLVKVGTTWTVEARALNVMISNGTDQRVRTFVYGGVAPKKYELEVTTDTNDGRRLQDEIQIQVKEF